MDLAAAIVMLLVVYRLIYGPAVFAPLKMGEQVPLGLSWWRRNWVDTLAVNSKLWIAPPITVCLSVPLMPWFGTYEHFSTFGRLRGWRLHSFRVQVTIGLKTLELALKLGLSPLGTQKEFYL